MKNKNKSYPVPVLSINGKPLMPTTQAKARKLLKNKQAVAFFKLGQFCIRLKFECSNQVQPVALGIDPGSKFQALSVINERANCYTHIMTNAITWVKERMETRSALRRSRRNRKTPYRQPRFDNRGNSIRSSRVPPSTKARWQHIYNLSKTLCSIYPISVIALEEISASTKKGKPKWNQSFGPLQSGKEYCHKKLHELCTNVKYFHGYDTHKFRTENINIKKSKEKNKEIFATHCIDSYCLGSMALGVVTQPDNTRIRVVKRIQFSRRQLHKQNFKKTENGIGQKPRTREGGTRSLGFTKGSIVKFKNLHTMPKPCADHNPSGYFLIGGYDENKKKITVCSVDNQNCRVNRNVNPSDLQHVAYNKYTYRWADKEISK